MVESRREPTSIEESDNTVARRTVLLAVPVLVFTLPLRLLGERLDQPWLSGAVVLLSMTLVCLIVMYQALLTRAYRRDSALVIPTALVAGFVSLQSAIPLWQLGIGLIILLFPVSFALLLKYSRVTTWRTFIPLWIAIVLVSLSVSLVQILIYYGRAPENPPVDAIVGLLGNERAANTLGFLTLFPAIVWALGAKQKQRVMPVLLVVLASFVAWLGDQKTVLFVSISFLLVFTIAAVVSSISHRNGQSARTALVAILLMLIVAPFVYLGFSGVATGSKARDLSQPLTRVTQLTAPIVSSKPENGEPNASLIPGGLGTGTTWLGQMIRDGYFNSARPLSLEMQGVSKEKIWDASIDALGSITRYGGIRSSPVATFSGLFFEIGLLGSCIWILTVLFMPILGMRLTGIPYGLALSAMLLPLGLLTPFLEYPEVTVGIVSSTFAWIKLRQTTNTELAYRHNHRQAELS